MLECKSDCDDYILGETGRTDSREQLGQTQPLNGTMGDDEFRKELPTMGHKLAAMSTRKRMAWNAVVELSQKLRLCC